MRHGVVQIDEEGATVVAFDESRGLVGEEVVRVVAVDIGGHPFAVTPQMVRELAMRVTVIEKPERMIEALAIGVAGRTRLTQPPLADDRRSVTGMTQHFSNRGAPPC